MSKQRRRRSKRSSSSFSVKKKRSGLRTVIETFMGISIGLVILAFVIWYYLLREETKEISNAQSSSAAITAAAIKDNVVNDQESYEAIRDSGKLSDLLHLLSQLDNWPRDAETPVRLDTLSKRLEIAQTILKLDGIDENQRVAVAKTVISAMGQIYGVSFEENLDVDGTVCSDYLNICNSFMADSNEEVAREALLGKVKATVYESTQEGVEPALDTIKENLKGLIDEYPNNSVVASTLRLLLKRVKAIDVGAGNELTKFVVEEFDNHDVTNANVSRQIRQLQDEVILAESGISNLAKVPATPEAFENYLEKLGELSDIPDTSIEIVNRIYNAVSHFEIKGENQNAIRILERLGSTAANRTDPVAKLQALRVCKFGLIRNKVVGQPFDFNDVDTKGNPVNVVQFSNHPVLVVFYSPNDPMSSTLFQELTKTYSLIAKSGLKVVVVAVEPADNKLGFEFDPEWTSVSNGRSSDGRISATSEIFKRCPVTHVPYFVLVDQNGIVNSINVPEPYIKTRVENVVATGKSSVQEPVERAEETESNPVQDKQIQDEDGQ